MKNIFVVVGVVMTLAFGCLLAMHLDQQGTHEQEQAALEAELKHFKEELVAAAHKNSKLEKQVQKITNDPNVWALEALGNASAGRVMVWLMLTTQQEANIKINKESCRGIMRNLVMMSKSFAEEGSKRGLSKFQVLYGLVYISYELEFAEKLCNAVAGKQNQIEALKKVFP